MASPSAPAAPRRGGPGHRLTVLRTERLTPHLVRVVLGGPGVVGIPDIACTDRYVKLAFRRPGVTYPEPLDVGAVRETMPRADWPIMRTYTIRSLDHAAGEMTIDFVVHGDEGVAGPGRSPRGRATSSSCRARAVPSPPRRTSTPTC